MDALRTGCTGVDAWLGHGCSWFSMPVSEADVDALGFGCTGSVDVTIVGAWMLLVAERVLDAWLARTLSSFGH